jgi:hypothetical protein
MSNQLIDHQAAMIMGVVVVANEQPVRLTVAAMWIYRWSIATLHDIMIILIEILGLLSASPQEITTAGFWDHPGPRSRFGHAGHDQMQPSTMIG